VVRDAADAERSPELAVLSVMLHGHGEEALAVAEAALAAARGLDDERSKLYADLVFASVAEGEAAGRAHALLAVLAARCLEVPADVRARITACTDLGLLDAWLARAVTATSVAEVVRDTAGAFLGFLPA
jgi:hypothetical protein